MNFKNHRELYEALLAGHEIECTTTRVKPWTVRMINDKMIVTCGIKIHGTPQFNDPTIWAIYTEPKWYDNIPEKGVICWVSDYSSIEKSNLAIIVNYVNEYFCTRNDNEWVFATPVKPEECFQEAAEINLKLS